MHPAAAAASTALKAGNTTLTLVIAPHASLLLPEVAGANDPCSGSREALVAALGRRAGACFVIVSPHAGKTGVYAQAAGDLAAHGLPQIVVAARTNEGGVNFARSWKRPLLESSIDHGALVPLALAPEGSFICCGISETETDTEKHAAGLRLAEAVCEMASGGPEVVLVLSAHSSASLTPRAPLTERSEGAAFDAALLELLRDEPARLAEFDAIDADLWALGGSCARGPFAALGKAAELTGRTAIEVLSYEAPVGVGYLVAESAG